MEDNSRPETAPPFSAHASVYQPTRDYSGEGARLAWSGLVQMLLQGQKRTLREALEEAAKRDPLILAEARRVSTLVAETAAGHDRQA